MKKLLLLLPFLLLFFINSVNAQTIWASDINGTEKNFFYSNESIYISSTKISTTTKTVDILVINDSSSLTNNSILSSHTAKSITTNSTGYIEPTLIWSSPIPGSYDIVVDTNRDGNYTDITDYVCNLTTTCFTVIAVPFPFLTFSVGSKSPSDHQWNASSAGDNVMLQLQVRADNENIKINSFDILASGSGNDKTGISLIRLTLDDNNNGIYESNESLLGFGKFDRDNGILTFPIGNGKTVNAGSTNYFLFLYTMSNSVYKDNNFSFYVISSYAVGESSGKTAKIYGLPIISAMKTISDSPLINQTITCENYKNETSCPSSSCKWCNSTSSCKNVTESCPPICYGSIDVILETHGNLSTARISGLYDCEGRTAFLRLNSCDGPTVGYCTISGTSCWISFSTPAEPGNHIFSACVDKDLSGSYNSDETKSSTLTVSSGPEPLVLNIDWNIMILLVCISALLISVIVVMLWFNKEKGQKHYSYEPKT